MFDQTHSLRKRIAIIGGGISGLSAAYYLSATHDITLYEAEPRLGGHARTVLAGKNGDQPVDTGFIVFNYVTYPNLTRLFRELDVPVIQSEMSFGASLDNGRLEYGLRNLRSILAQRGNLFRPKFLGMINDILRFGKRAEAAAQGDMTIGELVDELRLGTWFRDKYLMPMCGAIWSTPVEDVDQFPARSLVRFFRNHSLLAGMGEHQWWTVKGGSIEYVRRLEAALRARGVVIRTGAPVRGIERHADHVRLLAGQTTAETFDEVIFACHSDQALAILGPDASPEERATLGSIRYQPNRAVLHCDGSQMPRRRDCWSSWIYRSDSGRGGGVTYWMNRLQSIPATDPLFVTLNPQAEIAADKIYDTVDYAHPVFDGAALKAQAEIQRNQGRNRTWFVGAYNRHGFHEDGIASAMRVVRRINDVTLQKGAVHVSYEQSPEVAVS